MQRHTTLSSVLVAAAKAALLGLTLVTLSGCGHTIYGFGRDFERLGNRIQGRPDPYTPPAPPSAPQTPDNGSWGYYQ